MKIRGGVDCNRSMALAFQQIPFLATGTPNNPYIYGEGNEVESAVYNGAELLIACIFIGYDVAVDSSDFRVLCHNSIFMDNDIALRFAYNKNTPIVSVLGFNCNTFIKNGVAVQNVCFDSEYTPPYAFKARDNNFIGNDVDFDVDVPVRLYYYNNYFGGVVGLDWIGWNNKSIQQKAAVLDKLLGARSKAAIGTLIGYRLPQIDTTDAPDAQVFTDPRWVFPLAGWWYNGDRNASISSIFSSTGGGSHSLAATVLENNGGEEDYVNYLSDDWNSSTEILNTDTDTAHFDGAAFAAGGEKQIDVVRIVDGEAVTVGSWTFALAEPTASTLDSTPATPPDATGEIFNVGVSVAQTQDGAMAVEVVPSAVLGMYTPTLSIPCGDMEWEGVAVVGPSGPVRSRYDTATGTVTFDVAEGGQYLLSENDSDIYNIDAGWNATETAFVVTGALNSTLSADPDEWTIVVGQFRGDKLLRVKTEYDYTEPVFAASFSMTPADLRAGDRFSIFLLSSNGWKPISERIDFTINSGS